MTAIMVNDFLNEQSYGNEIDATIEVLATTVNMPSGFVYNQVGAAGTLQAGDTPGGMWLWSHTAGAAEIAALHTINHNYQFLIGQPMRFVADVTFQLLATEFNFFVGCGNAIATAMTITAGGGMKVAGDHFGFYTPDSSSTVFGTPANIFCVSQESGVAIITELTALNSIDRVAHPVSVGSHHMFRAEYVPTGPVPVPAGTAVVIFDAEIQFYIDGVLVAVHNHSGANQITIADTEVMQFGIYTENITSVATLELRQLKCRQLRVQPRF